MYPVFMLSESSSSAHLCLFIIILNIHLANSTNICNKKEKKEKPCMPVHPVAARETLKRSLIPSRCPASPPNSFSPLLPPTGSQPGLSASQLCCFVFFIRHPIQMKANQVGPDSGFHSAAFVIDPSLSLWSIAPCSSVRICSILFITCLAGKRIDDLKFGVDTNKPSKNICKRKLQNKHVSFSLVRVLRAN